MRFKIPVFLRHFWDILYSSCWIVMFKIIIVQMCLVDASWNRNRKKILVSKYKLIKEQTAHRLSISLDYKGKGTNFYSRCLMHSCHVVLATLTRIHWVGLHCNELRFPPCDGNISKLIFCYSFSEKPSFSKNFPKGFFHFSVSQAVYEWVDHGS